MTVQGTSGLRLVCYVVYLVFAVESYLIMLCCVWGRVLLGRWPDIYSGPPQVALLGIPCRLHRTRAAVPSGCSCRQVPRIVESDAYCAIISVVFCFVFRD